MVVTSVRADLRPLHPIHAMLLAFPLSLFLSALVSDVAYRSTYEVQWINLASWLIAGGLLVGAFALIWALIDVFRSQTTRRGHSVAYFVVLLVMWALGFVNALVHAKDAWGTMPAGLYLSIVVALLALAAAWIGYSGPRTGEVK